MPGVSTILGVVWRVYHAGMCHIEIRGSLGVF